MIDEYASERRNGGPYVRGKSVISHPSPPLDYSSGESRIPQFLYGLQLLDQKITYGNHGDIVTTSIFIYTLCLNLLAGKGKVMMVNLNVI